jgi:hypothetical protein
MSMLAAGTGSLVEIRAVGVAAAVRHRFRSTEAAKRRNHRMSGRPANEVKEGKSLRERSQG